MIYSIHPPTFTLPLGQERFILLIDFLCIVCVLKANYLIIDAGLMQNDDFFCLIKEEKLGFDSVRPQSGESCACCLRCTY